MTAGKKQKATLDRTKLILKNLIYFAKLQENRSLPDWWHKWLKNSRNNYLKVELIGRKLRVTYTINAIKHFVIENIEQGIIENPDLVELDEEEEKKDRVAYILNKQLESLKIGKRTVKRKDRTPEAEIYLDDLSDTIITNWESSIGNLLSIFERSFKKIYIENEQIDSQEIDPLRQFKNRIPSEFDLLDREFFEERAGEQEENNQILELRSATWSFVINGHYIERDCQQKALKLAKKLSFYRNISFLIIRGMPGAGKTALLKWLVYQLSNENRIVLQKNEEIQNYIRNLNQFSKDNNKQHFYLLTEELFRDESLIENLRKNELQFPLTIISTTRLNEDRQESKLTKYTNNIKNIDLKLSSIERSRIVNSIKAKDSKVRERIDKEKLEFSRLIENSDSMLVLMLQLSEGKRFDQIIADVIKKLPNDDNCPIYQVFGLICSSYQYHVAVYRDVIYLCLQEKYSREAISRAIESSIRRELKGLVHETVINRGDFQGFATVHELIAETAIREAKSHDEHKEYLAYPTDLLEIHLENVIENKRLDPQVEPHIRWFLHTLRALCARSPEDLNKVRQLLNRYSENIKLLQHDTTIMRLASWANMYAVAGLKSEKERCIDALIATKPQDSKENDRKLSEIARKYSPEQIKQLIKESTASFKHNPHDFHLCPKFFKLVKDRGSSQQKRKTIDFANWWLKRHDDDDNVRSIYLSFVRRFGMKEQKGDAINTAFRWVEDHRNDTSVRTQYLVLVENCGTNEQKKDAFSSTTRWLEQHLDNIDVRQKFLSLIEKWEANTRKQIEDIVDDNNILEIYLALKQKWEIYDRKQEQNEIRDAVSWLEIAPDNPNARVNYLTWVEKSGI